MQNYYHNLIFCSTILIVLLASSCKKEVGGCNDTAASNYSNYVDFNDGSCVYEGEASFYYSYSSKSNFLNDGITKLELFVEGEFIGLLDTDLSVTSMGCLGSQWVKRTFEMGGSQKKNLLLAVKDQNTGLVIFSTEFELFAANCIGVNIEY